MEEGDAWYFAVDEQPEGPYTAREIGRLILKNNFL
jgi:hypothetical protein